MRVERVIMDRIFIVSVPSFFVYRDQDSDFWWICKLLSGTVSKLRDAI